jgi:hypothetical protein
MAGIPSVAWFDTTRHERAINGLEIETSVHPESFDVSQDRDLSGRVSKGERQFEGIASSVWRTIGHTRLLVKKTF